MVTVLADTRLSSWDGSAPNFARKDSGLKKIEGAKDKELNLGKHQLGTHISIFCSNKGNILLSKK